MKAKFIATALLSLSLGTLSAYANPQPEKTTIQQTVQTEHKIDLNKADLSTLVGSFKGIGKKRAESIIAYRDSHQGFKSLEELAEVKGLGQHFVTANREKLNEVFVIH